MDGLLKADIFFFLTSIAVVLITIVLLIAFYYIIKILRDIHELSELIKDEGEHIIHDIDSARNSVKRKGKSLGIIISNIMSSKKEKKHSKKRT
jgi:hypothetical protein